MALKKRTATGKYVKIKDGKFYLSTDKDNTDGFDELEGQLIDMYFKDETYEGTEQRKLYLVLNDEDENFIIGLRFDSSYASSFLNFVNNVNLKRPITLHPISKEETAPNGTKKTRNSLLISQNGKFAKSYFTKESPNGLPQMRKVKISGKEQWDRTDMLEFFEDMVETKLKPQLVKTVETAKTNIIEHNDDPFPESEDDNVLPWEK